MADTRISALAEETSPQDTDEVIVQRGGSANYRVSVSNLLAGVGGGGLDFGEQIFAWNRTDTSQFESSPHLYLTDLGGGPPNDVSLQVVPESTHGVIGVGNALEMSFNNSIGGGALFGILTSAIDGGAGLPNRFVMRIHWMDATNSFVKPRVGFYTPDDGGGDFQGFFLGKNRGGSDNIVGTVVNNQDGSSATVHSPGTWDDAVRDLGGIRQTVTVYRQSGATPAACRILTHDMIPDLADEGGHDGQLPHLISGVGTNWDGLDIDRVGIGAYYGGGGAQIWEVRFSDLRLYRHPWDM